jgi:hypothetical protein
VSFKKLIFLEQRLLGMNSILAQIRQDLKTVLTKTQNSVQRFFKEQGKFYGVKN